MFVKKTMPGFAIRFERQARIISSILFGFIVIGAVFDEKENIVEYFEAAGSIVLTLNVIMMSLATILSKFSNLEVRQRIAITLECGLQNGTLAIFVALTLIGNATMMVPGGIYSLLMFASAIAYTLFMKRCSS